MSETSELELFTNRAMLIHASEMTFAERRLAFSDLLDKYAARVRIEVMDEGLENEEKFKNLRLADCQ